MSIWSAYAQQLAGWALEQGFTLPNPPEHIQHPAHLFAVLAPDLEQRQRLIAHLDAVRVKAVFHYVPLHSSPMGRRLDPNAELPVTDSVSDRLVRLPLFAGLRADELDRVIDGVTSFES